MACCGCCSSGVRERGANATLFRPATFLPACASPAPCDCGCSCLAGRLPGPRSARLAQLDPGQPFIYEAPHLRPATLRHPPRLSCLMVMRPARQPTASIAARCYFAALILYLGLQLYRFSKVFSFMGCVFGRRVGQLEVYPKGFGWR